jgi:hypothetical protein
MMSATAFGMLPPSQWLDEDVKELCERCELEDRVTKQLKLREDHAVRRTEYVEKHANSIWSIARRRLLDEALLALSETRQQQTRHAMS